MAQKLEQRMVASGKNAEQVVTEERLRSQVLNLSDSLGSGRECGTKGANETAFWISGRFAGNGLLPVGGDFTHSFKVGDKIGRNIVGFLPGKRNYDKETYTIIAANYDSRGVIDGKLYPGADSNASGVVAMLSLSDMFKKMVELGRVYGRNIIFVALDAKEKNSAGAAHLWEEIQAGRFADPVSGETILPRRIHSFVSLDIVGSSLEPIHPGRKDYLIMMSGRQFIDDLRSANKDFGLDLGFDYYGSSRFTDLFYSKIGGQSVFVENDIISVVFTSGITLTTNKTTDTAKTLNYEVFRDRIFLIFHWLTKIL